MQPCDISIEYCVKSNYGPQALRLTEDLLRQYTPAIKSVRLIPSGQGRFEVMLDDEILFSKQALNRMPEQGEILQAFQQYTQATPSAAK